MKKSIKVLATTLSGLGVVGGATAIVVACGTSESGDFSRIRVAYEKQWKKTMDNALATLTPAEQASFDLVEIQDGSSVAYLDRVTNNPSDFSTADLFSLPSDRYSSLVTGNILYPVDSVYDATQYDESYIGRVDGKQYAFPVNVESVIQIYHKSYDSATADAAFTADRGWSTYSAGFTDAKFISQWGNLWNASPYLNGIMIAPNAPQTTIDKAKELWVTGTKGSFAYPVLSNATFISAAKTLWTENNDLRSSSDAWKKSLANNPDGTNRDAIMRRNFINGNIQSMIEGPWSVNDLVAWTITTSSDKNDEAAISAKLDDIGAAAIPDIAANQPARHFKGGWGYSINGSRLSKVATAQQATKLALEAKFLKALTAKERASDWFTTGGKISAAKGSSVTVSADEAKAIKLTDPQNANGTIDFSPYGNTFATALSNLYTRMITAVSAQTANNVEQPSGPAWNLWEAWDKLGLSLKEIGTSDTFITNFNKNAQLQLAAANK